MRFNAPAAFEFSAVPLLLQRLPAPPSLLQLLTNSTRLDELGISLLMHVRVLLFSWPQQDLPRLQTEIFRL